MMMIPFAPMTTALVLTTLVALPLTAAETYKIGPEASKVTFSIKNKPPGGNDFQDVPGSFKEFSGTWSLNPADLTKSTVQMEVKTTSVDTANEKRDDHLRSQDFFKVKEFPSMSFKSAAFKKVSDDTYEVTGAFTLLGKTKPVKVMFKTTGAASGTATFQIKRSEFGMTYRVPDTADEVDVKLDIVGTK